MSEASFWGSQVRPALKGRDPVRVENPAVPGTPDVNYVEGWIELKQQDRWPVREETLVRLDHDMTQEQRVWAVQRHHAGGRVHLLLKIGRDILLLRGDVAARYLGRSTKAELIEHAQAYWPAGKNFRKELQSELDNT